MGFGGGSSPPPPAPVPTRDTAEVQAEASRERMLAAQRAGRSSTIMTGGQGLATEEQPSLKKKTLGSK